MYGQMLLLLTFVFIGTVSLVPISLVCPLAENVNVLSINVRVVTVLNEKDIFFSSSICIFSWQMGRT